MRDQGQTGTGVGADDGPLLIGLTGPIGCGKSTVAGWLRAEGGTVVDADEIAREVTARGQPALAAIRERFGNSVVLADGSLDRTALASIVFRDPDALRDLERIVHPAVRRRIERAVAEAATAAARFVVVEAIKLVEGGYADVCDEVWLIECSAAAQRSRLADRGIPSEDAERRLAAQGPDLADRLAPAATRRITTDGSPEETRALVGQALAEALALPRGVRAGGRSPESAGRAPG